MKALESLLYSLRLLLLGVIGLVPSLLFADMLRVTAQADHEDSFPLSTAQGVANICIDSSDYQVVAVAAGMLADDIRRVTGKRAMLTTEVPHGHAAVVAGTLGHSRLVDQLVNSLNIDVSAIRGRWESFVITTAIHPTSHVPLLIVVGSDRRGTAYGLTTLSQSIGVSPWYWWADVTPVQKTALYVEPGYFVQREPSVQYRGIFINDERFGGWARWAEQHFESETGQVGPKTYQRVFELLLRLKANLLWPAMHPGTAAFNSNPENARLADDYAIVMGSSHCEQMLRNNEGEWKAVGTYGDFNYITNRETMQRYWEERVRTNGGYENIYTLGLRGIHDYPMEGANSTAERVALMQQAIDDQREMLSRNINRPITDIPQILCTYEEVLDAYHDGLQVPDDVTLLWSDDKHGYCRNLCNPSERQRRGGAGIYYHLSYHGDPASWIWLSPLSPSFLSTELTKAYDYGASKMWVFNVGDIKPAEKELSFVMELAWDIDRWRPCDAHDYIRQWAECTFGADVADEIAGMQSRYYRLQAGGKDAHVWLVDYTERQAATRVEAWRTLAREAVALTASIPASLQTAYFELVSYPICGAAMLNEYQLLARRSMTRASRGEEEEALADAQCVREAFDSLNHLTRHYNDELLDGKWAHFFNWQPYFWYRSEQIDPPLCTPALLEQVRTMPTPRFLPVEKMLGAEGAAIECATDADVPLWMEALTPIRNFSKAASDNVFCRVSVNSDSFEASATPVGNVWHATHIGPMWSQVGTLHLHRGTNRIRVSDLKADARIDRIYMGLYPPFATEPDQRIRASDFSGKYEPGKVQVKCVDGLGYVDGVVVLPFTQPSYSVAEAPYVEYEVDVAADDMLLEVRTLPTLHVYEGRDARYAIQLGEGKPQTFSIHADDFSAEWRKNVLRGYASRTIRIPHACRGRQKLRIYLLDPGIVLQEILVYGR